MNGVKTALLLGLLSGLLLFGGQMIAGRSGLEIALVLAVVMNFASYFFSDKIALATYSAQPVTPEENPEVYRRVFPLVQSLVQRMGLPMPKLWLIPDASPNAFATGRNPAHAGGGLTTERPGFPFAWPSLGPCCSSAWKELRQPADSAGMRKARSN